MKKIKIKIDLTDKVQARAMQAFLSVLLEEQPKEVVKVEAEPVEKPKPKPRARKPKTEVVKAETTQAEVVKAETTQAAKTESDPAQVGISEIRELLQAKVKDHRAELKKKLTALGAKNVTTLEESKYAEFYEFLNSLD